MGKNEEWSREGEGRRDKRRWQKLPSNAVKATTRSLWRHHQVSQRKVNMLADVAELSSSMYSVKSPALKGLYALPFEPLDVVVLHCMYTATNWLSAS